MAGRGINREDADAFVLLVLYVGMICAIWYFMLSRLRCDVEAEQVHSYCCPNAIKPPG